MAQTLQRGIRKRAKNQEEKTPTEHERSGKKKGDANQESGGATRREAGAKKMETLISVPRGIIGIEGRHKVAREGVA